MATCPDISLIICTRNRGRRLTRCLDAVRQITSGRDWELVIVDNGSTDETSAVAREFVDASPIEAVLVLEPAPGKSNALNTALRIARGEILAFTDDDCYPAPDFLDCTWDAFRDPSVGYITGRIMLHDPADYPYAVNESCEPLKFPAGQYIRPGAVMGANMAFRRSVLLDIGGFDPMFGPGTSYVVEDHDAAVRAAALGWNGLYCPEVVVRHHHGRTAADMPRMARLYGMGAGALHMKLLLKHREYALFKSAVRDFGYRYTRSGRLAMWEVVGALSYVGSLLTRKRAGCEQNAQESGRRARTT
jgi:glycosyltransferase involved in cell wall biosynthesis